MKKHAWNKCPVCGSDLVHEESRLDAWLVCESEDTCPTCKMYRSEFSYGVSSTWINGSQVSWSSYGDNAKGETVSKHTYQKILRDARKKLAKSQQPNRGIKITGSMFFH